MNGRLPCLTTLVLLLGAPAAIAQDAGPLPVVRRPLSDDHGPRTTDQEPKSVGDRLLLQAATQLERRESVTARLRHQVHLEGADLYGIGSYQQQGRGENIQVRLELQIAGQQSSMLQVSNGRFLWTDMRLPTGRNVARVDLRQLRADPLLASRGQVIEPGHASWSPIQPELLASGGGLPTLLASLSENFTFLPPQAMRLSFAPPLVPEAVNIPVFAVVGHWRPEKLKTLLKTPTTESSDAAEPLPPRFPQEVLVLVGQADLFPYRIEYHREPSTTPGSVRTDDLRGRSSRGVVAPYQLSATPMVVLELSDVSFNAPIAASQFDYTPGDAEWNDRTAEYLDRLRQRR